MSKIKLIGILNITPDSFSDGGLYIEKDYAIKRAKKMIDMGIDIIDIGAESTRPNAKQISEQEELKRLGDTLKKIAELCQNTRTKISIDTYKFAVAKEMVAQGADIVNCICGNEDFMKMAQVSKEVIFSHALTVPADKSINIDEDLDPVKVISDWALKIKKNIPSSCKAIIDPGLGFGKNTKQTWEILRRISELKQNIGDQEICIGHSKKRFMEHLNKKNSTLAVSMYLARSGVDYIRVHEVEEHREMIKLLNL